MPDGEVVINLHPMKEKRVVNAGFTLFGENKNAAIKLCHWTKKSIRTGEEEHCYKEKFYGIQSHRCVQMTPALPFCNLCCQFCWRDVSLRNPEWKGHHEDPKEIADKSVELQRMLLQGLGGVPHSDKHLEEAMTPKHVAISLDGEPTLYPKLPEMIQEYHKKGMTTFLVTNGTNPEAIRRLIETNSLPTQLYTSLSACTEEMFKLVDKPLQPGLWQKLNETIDMLPNVKTRRVIRLTMVKGLNMFYPEKYAEFIKRGQPDFVECKSAVAVGFARSQGRLKYEDMASHEEIREFAKDVARFTGYEVVNEKEDSRVVLLSKSMAYYLSFSRLS